MIFQLCADVLCVPIFVFSSAQDMDVSVLFPSKRQLSVSPTTERQVSPINKQRVEVILMEYWKRILMIVLGQVCVLNQSLSSVFEVFVSFLEIAAILKKRNKFLRDLQKPNAAKTLISMFFSNFFS